MPTEVVHRKQSDGRHAAPEGSSRSAAATSTASPADDSKSLRKPLFSTGRIVLLVVIVAFICMMIQLMVMPVGPTPPVGVNSRFIDNDDFNNVPDEYFKAENEAMEVRNITKPPTEMGTVPSRDDIMKVFPPYRDLCRFARKQGLGEMAASGKLRAMLENTMNRFEHMPADGGAVGQRWSTATGLPLASHRTGGVKVRFLTVNNRLDPMMHFASVTAAMAGVRLDMIGMGWKHFSFLKRPTLMLSYADLEGLSDADIIVATDADAVMSGEEAEGFYAAFIASTAASEEEHKTYKLHDIRLGKRMAPVLFSAEQSCFHVQVLDGTQCSPSYYRLFTQLEAWAASANMTMQPNQYSSNPLRYLNAGVMITRVWALRRLAPAFVNFAKSHRPRRKMKVRGRWWCDQAVFGSLYLDLLWWELNSNALSGTPVALPAEKWKESLFPPKSPLPAGEAPHNLLAGLIGIDESARMSLTLNPNGSPKNLYRINQNVIHSVRRPESALVGALAKGMPVGLSPVGVPRSLHELVISPRPNVDCFGVHPIPTHCAYRNEVLGLPEDATLLVPLMWHFAGPWKHRMYLHYRALFSWYTAAMANTTNYASLERFVASFPPTRVFSIDPKTNTNEYLGHVALLKHTDSDDVTVSHMCETTVLKSAE